MNIRSIFVLVLAASFSAAACAAPVEHAAPAPTAIPDDVSPTPVAPPKIEPKRSGVPLPPNAACEARTGGAFVDFEIKDHDGSRPAERLTVWSTSPAFIAESARLMESGERRVPMFERVVDGVDCDTQYSWHLDAANMHYTDASTEVCDAEPSFVEEVKVHWISAVGRYCPWNAKVVGVR